MEPLSLTDTPTATTSTSSQEFFQTFYRPPKSLSNTQVSNRPFATSTGTPQQLNDLSKLPVHPELQNMTQSQRLFSITTGINARSLTISSNDEFFLFMELQAERQWASF